MLLLFLLDCFKTYIPLLYGVHLCIDKQTSNKTSIQKLIKFIVIRAVLSLFQHITVDLVSLNRSIYHLVMLLIFVYLTVYNYTYAEAVYNILIAPFMNVFSAMVTNIDNEIKGHNKKISFMKAMEQQKDKSAGQTIKIEPIGFFKRFIHNAFNDPLIFTQADKKS